jgi:hypothetical protein
MMLPSMMVTSALDRVIAVAGVLDDRFADGQPRELDAMT